MCIVEIINRDFLSPVCQSKLAARVCDLPEDGMASKVSAAVPIGSASTGSASTAASAPAAAVAIAIHSASTVSGNPLASHGPILSKEVKLDELSKYFHLPEKAVAKELGICLTSLKKLCRSYGITRWPFRKLKSLERTMRKVQTVCWRVAKFWSLRKDTLRRDSRCTCVNWARGFGVASRKEACEKSFCKFSADSWCTVRKRGIERMGWQESEAGNGENGEGENGHKPSNEVKVGVVTFA